MFILSVGLHSQTADYVYPVYKTEGQCIETKDQLTGEPIYYWSADKQLYGLFGCYGEWEEWDGDRLIKTIKHEAQTIKYSVDITVSDSLFNLYNAEFCKLMDSTYYVWLTKKQKLYNKERQKYADIEKEQKKQDLIKKIEESKMELEKLK